jgi:hypothetical protein
MPADPAIETVSPSEILQSAGAEAPVNEGTFLERTGLSLATGVGALAAIVTLALVAKWAFSAPAAPVISVDSDPSKVQAALANYKLLQQTALDPYTSLFDSVVVKVLLPVFTTILGFIFGSKRASSG